MFPHFALGLIDQSDRALLGEDVVSSTLGQQPDYSVARREEGGHASIGVHLGVRFNDLDGLLV